MVRAFIAPILAALALFSVPSAATGLLGDNCNDASVTTAPPTKPVDPITKPVTPGEPSYPVDWFIAAEAPSYNNHVVSDLLSNLDDVRNPGEAYAAFDWDNTCMYGDISYTSVYYQVDNLVYRIPPSQFESVFALGYDQAGAADACMPKGLDSVIGKDAAGKDVTLKQTLASTSADYKTLYESYIAPTLAGGSVSLEDTKATDAYKNFRAKISFLTFGLEAMNGGDERSECSQKIAMTVFPQLLVGMTDAEIRALIKASLRWNLAAKLDEPTFTSTGDLAVKGSYSTGLRVFNGQETTMRALRQQGADVFIISASPQVFVEEVAQFTGLTYLVPKTNVYGVRFTFADNKFTGQLVGGDYPITWGPGKATIVEKFLKPAHNGKAPIYASGDSNGDCDFMNTVRDGVVHTNNRLKSVCIEEFYEKSCQYYGTKDALNNRYLLQGQDKVIGSWIPTGYTTKDGVTYKVGTTTFTNCSSYALQN